MLLVFVLLMLGAVPKGNAIIFSYIRNVEDLLLTQIDVVKNLKNHLPYVDEAKKSLILKFIKRCEREQSIAEQDIKEYFYNPINGYTLLKRLSVELNVIEDILIRHSSKSTYYKKHSRLRYPTETEMDAANIAMTHLTVIYHLNVTELANGTLKGSFNKNGELFINYVSPMTSNDCYELAMVAYSLSRYENAHAWANEALRKYHDDCDGDCTHTKQDLLHFIDMLHEQDIREGTKDNFRSKEVRHQTSYDIIKKSFVKQIPIKLFNINSRDLCSKERTIDDSRLRCQYKTGPHPILLLARLKTETLHLDPEVLLMYDFISDEEISVLRKLAVKEFQTTNKVDVTIQGTSVVNCDSPYNIDRTIRMAACLNDSYGTAAVVTRRARSISGLTLGEKHVIQAFLSSNDTQLELLVAAYGAAGVHDAHVDTPLYFTHTKVLNDVSQGGATIFTQMNLSVFPVKGSALYWQSVRRPNGEFDDITEHAACPVFYGSKWISVKFLIRSETPAQSEYPVCDVKVGVEGIEQIDHVINLNHL